MEKSKNDLYCAIMEGRWPKVYNMLREDRGLFMAKVTAIEDTVLHMAMYAPKAMKPFVAAMVDLVREDEESSERASILGAANLKGDTPLHLAASIGNVEMCKKIGETDYSLILRRNEEGETPLFTAVLYGQRNAFLWLYYCLDRDSPAVSSTHCVRKNKDTILHCAIAQGRFDVAIEIFYLYDDLVDPMRLNDKGLSPLHLLAEKPSAFYSGTFLGRPFGYFAYYVLLWGDQKKKKATTKAELMESEHKSWVNQWINEMKPTEMVTKAKKMVMKAKEMIIWVLDRFDLAGQPIYEFVGVVRKKKEKHAWSRQIMEKLLERYSDSFLKSSHTKEDSKPLHIDPPLLIAAKNGVIEMVKVIVEEFQLTVDIGAVNEERKNIVLLAAENRQTHVYEYLCKPETLALTGSLFKQVDNEGNSALHLAARYGGDRNWKFPGEVLIMQWEYKWLKYVRNSMPPGVFATYNSKWETPDEIFKETHKDMIERDNNWLTKTAEACSLVSTLIATVAFATAATVPGSFNQTPENPTENGFPVFLHNKVYQLFVAMSLAALFFSLVATILLLSIVTARYHVVDFFTNLPSRLFLGMSSMFMSIMCMWISFCSSHSFLLVQRARNVYIPLYILTSIPGTIFAITKFPVYWNLLTSSFYKTPASSYNLVPARPNLPKKKLTCADALNRLVKICDDYEN